ncbi:MAG TPA: hypothetical protein VII63_04905 [Caulobacteraceae bacterium]
MARAEAEANGGGGRGMVRNGAALGASLMHARFERKAAGPAELVAFPVAAPAERARERPSEGLDAVFGAGPFSHQIVLRLEWVAGTLDLLARTVADGGAALQAMNLSELDGGFSAKIWIKGVSCDAARRLSDALAALAPVSYTHVEHHLGRSAAS